MAFEFQTMFLELDGKLMVLDASKSKTSAFRLLDVYTLASVVKIDFIGILHTFVLMVDGKGLWTSS